MYFFINQSKLVKIVIVILDWGDVNMQVTVLRLEKCFATKYSFSSGKHWINKLKDTLVLLLLFL